MIITFIGYFVVIFLAIQVGYLLFFSIAGLLARPETFKPAQKYGKIRVFIPGYKEDFVIIDTAKNAVTQDYPKDRFEVVIIADSFSEATLAKLRVLPIRVIEVSFEKSTKGKAMHKAVQETKHEPVDIVVVLDADNHMSQGFLKAVNNAFEQGYQVIQGHRTAKNMQTPFALLDACSEEINNHIFRRGHVAVGLPSALIGSGMAFDANVFASLLENIGDSVGEDKEFELRLLKQRKRIAFLDGVFVLDEKVSNKDVFSKQRSRWIASQIAVFKKYFVEGWVELFKGNIAFFEKTFQSYLLPRVMLIGLTGIWLILSLFIFKEVLYYSIGIFIALVIALLLGVPLKWYNKQLLKAVLRIPGALFSMVKALFNAGQASKKFIHTPHGENTH